MRCQTCGEELREGARFCPTCGTPTSAASAAVTPPTVQVRRPAAQPANPTPQPTSPATPSIAPASGTDDATMRLPDPAPRANRDPGAGYDPVAPPRPAARSTVRPSRPAAAGGAASLPFQSATGADFSTLMQRIQRLMRLDTSVFSEVYNDSAATIPVAVYAAVVLLISGLGGMLFIANTYGFDTYELVGSSAGGFFLKSVLLGTIFALAMTAAWAGITMLLLRQFASANVDFYGLLRVLGLCLTPLVLALLMFIKDGYFALSWIALGGVVSLAVIAVLESIDVRPGLAWLATIAGFAIFVIVLQFLGHEFRDLAPGFFAAA